MKRDSRCALVMGDNISYCRQKFPIEDYEITPHAIIGALSKARARDFAGGTAYVSSYPCSTCAKALAAAKIARVVYKDDNSVADTTLTSQIFAHFGIEVVRNEELEL